MGLDEEYYKEAKKIVKKKKGFYTHLTTWIVCCIFFFLLNNLTSPNETWWVFPTLGWGLGLAIHFISVFGFTRSKRWEDKAIKKEMQKLQKAYPSSGNHEKLDLDKIPNRERYASDDFETLQNELDDQEFV